MSVTRLHNAGLAALLLAALAPLGGCGMMAGADKAYGTENSCDDNRDCAAAGSVCDLSQGICVSPTSAGRDLLVEVAAPANRETASLPAQYFLHQGDVKSVGRSSFTLSEFLDIEGMVRWNVTRESHPAAVELCETFDEEGLCVVSARVELTSLGEFPDSIRPPLAVETGKPAPGGVGSNPGSVNFKISAPPGGYALTVTPASPFDAMLPPLDVLVGREIDGPMHLLATYPEPGAMRVIDARVWKSDGGSVSSISVWAIDPDSGERISSIARIDANSVPQPSNADGEEFRLFLMPAGGGESPSRFSVAITSTEQSPEIPTNMRFGPYDFNQLDALDDQDGYVNLEAAGAEASRLVLPPLGVRIQYQATVEGLGPLGELVPAESVQVRFYNKEIGSGGNAVKGSYEVLSTTDADGRILGPDGASWGVWLLEGYYEVTLYPPLQSDYESLSVGSIMVKYPGQGDPVQMGQAFQLQRKKPVSGWVRQPSSGKSSGLMTLEAYPLADQEFETDSGGSVPRFNTWQSRDDGSFSVALDAGLYDLLFKTDPLSSFPWVWVEGVSVEDGGRNLTVDLPDPTAFQGSVFTADGSPLPGAGVKVYDLTYSGKSGEAPVTRQVCKAATGSDGRFICLLAP